MFFEKQFFELEFHKLSNIFILSVYCKYYGGLLGGVHIKLKMGKADSTSAEAPSAEQKESKPQSEEVQKEDVESLRKVIKLDQKEEESEENAKEPEKEEEPEETEDLTDVTSMIEEEPQPAAPASTREELEQKRAILQRIKDFDFQIKKNQQDINSVTEKINSLSKDLDDLVSLYEIVSEQMNPFVGLSKVTRKRLESLENITHEIDGIKERLSYMDLSENGSVSKSLRSQTSIEPGEVPLDSNPINPEQVPSFETNLTDEQVERIIEVSFSGISLDQTIDNAIDGFIESLKAGKVN